MLYTTGWNDQLPLILSNSGSFFWHSILTLRPHFHSCTKFRILSGKQISFWFDGWAGQALLPEKGAPMPHRKISLHDARTRLHQLLPAPLTLQQSLAVEKMHQLTLQPGNDTPQWDISPSGNFSVSSVYRILSQGGKLRSALTFMWKARTTPTMKCFFFFLLNNRLPTHDVLQRRNINFTPRCVLCASCPHETAMHLFFRCPYASTIWSSLSLTLGYQLLRLKETVQLTYLASAPNAPQLDPNRRQSWHSTFITATWLIWKERNERIFRGKSVPPAVLAVRIQHEANLCLAYC